jgi:hypothetical protein
MSPAATSLVAIPCRFMQIDFPGTTGPQLVFSFRSLRQREAGLAKAVEQKSEDVGLLL